MLDLDAPPSVSPAPLAVSSTLSGLAGEKRRASGRRAGACQSALPPYRATGTGVMAECSYSVQRGTMVEEAEASPSGQGVSHHMDKMD